jgi:inosine-uridine nucleoside N-ribohydrolase
MTTKMLIDTDPAMGTKDSDPEDSFAITFALNSPEIDLVGITVVQGNVPVTHGFSNATHLLHLLGRTEVPIGVGQYLPLHPERRPTQVAWLEDGERRERVVGHATRTAHTPTAVELIASAARENSGELVIAAIGPLTNIAAALRQHPDLVDHIKELWVMGGAFTVSGNHTPFAEFNFWADPEAADEVSRSGLKVTYVGLDVCNETKLTKEQIAANERGTELGAFVRQSCEPWFGAMSDMDTNGLHLYDTLTVAASVTPGLLELLPSWITVDAAEGVAQGASGAWMKQFNGPWLKPSGEPTGLVATGVDLETFDRLFAERVLAAL